MSAVRMCDKCGRIFPEGEEGSATGNVTVNMRNPRSGRVQPETKAVDYCAMCNGGSDVQPRVLSIEGGSKDGSGPATFVDSVVGTEG